VKHSYFCPIGAATTLHRFCQGYGCLGGYMLDETSKKSKSCSVKREVQR